MKRYRIKLPFTLTLILFIALSGCRAAIEGEQAYDLAQACVVIKTHDSNSYIVATDAGYRLAEVEENEAEKFYLRPTGLEYFLLYDRNGKYFGLNFLNIERFDTASDQTEWRIHDVNISKGSTNIAKAHTLISKQAGLRLSHKNQSMYFPKANIAMVTAERSSFDLLKQNSEDCKVFPQDDLDAEISREFYTPKNPNDPVKGFADYHTHIGLPKSMASVVVAGDVFHPYGIEHALKDCRHLHGNQGALDILGMQTSSDSTSHSTRGYPHFDDWPDRVNVSHVTAYYRWIERAYLAGLRLMVTHATGNPAFCQLMSMVHFTQAKGDCSASDTVRLQTEYIYQLQDYIDAQQGGPGKGWFRIATTSQEARQYINDNKLAVILGSEYGSLFNCRSSNTNCDDAFVDQELNKLHQMGIRAVFPVHRFDNAFGGAQYGGITWMHLASKIDTGHIDHLTDLINPWKLLFKPVGGNFFDMQTCPEGVQGDKDAPSMQDFFEKDFSIITNALREVPQVGFVLEKGLDLVFLNKLGPVPDYAHLKDSTSNCNARSLQTVGKHLINRIIDKGMILEIDHMSYNTTMETLKILEARNYSGVVSSHGLVRHYEDSVDRIFQLGGLAVTFPGSPKDTLNNINKFKGYLEKTPYEVGVGFGSDAQGIVTFSSGDEGYVPKYPFDSYDGTVSFTQPKIGNRHIDFASEGLAHYGLFAEWVDNLKQNSVAEGDNSFEIFMNSAEAYLQMWARAEAAAIE